MESGSAREFASELGDLLLQVVFHSMLAEEAGRFTIADVIESIHTKMVRRHPHVFGDAKAATSAASAQELGAAQGGGARRGRKGARNERPRTEVASCGSFEVASRGARGVSTHGRASRIGFDWDDLAGIFDKIDEEKREILAAMVRKAHCSTHGARRKQPAACTRKSRKKLATFCFAA